MDGEETKDFNFQIEQCQSEIKGVCEDDVKIKQDRIKEVMVNIEAYFYELDFNKRVKNERPVKLKEETITFSSLNTQNGK